MQHRDLGLRYRKEHRLKEPEEFRVILLNDHYTTMEFVVEILMLIFHKSLEEANSLMLEIHKTGRSVVGVYPFDIAVTKTSQVRQMAQEREFPLKCMVEQA